jgi:hypothetical protein
VVGLLLGLAVVASCQSPGGGERVRPGSLPPASTQSPVPTSGPPSPTRGPRPTSAPTFSEASTVDCAGYPSADQVIAVLRRTTDVLPTGVTPTVLTAPQCSGTWQYTIVSVPDREPLQVVTRGTPTTLQLVTAGTDICSIAVRTQAPYGIRTLARCPAP